MPATGAGHIGADEPGRVLDGGALTYCQQLLVAGVPASDIILTSADMFERLRVGSTSGYRELAKYLPIAIAPGRWRLSDVHQLEHAATNAALAEAGMLSGSAAPVPDPRKRRRSS